MPSNTFFAIALGIAAWMTFATSDVQAECACPFGSLGGHHCDLSACDAPPCSECSGECACCGEADSQKQKSCLDWILPRSNLPLPLMKEAAEERGVTLPLPLGVSIVSTELDRTVGVSDLRVGLGNNPPQPVQRFSVGDLDAHASSQIARLDCWFLPCLNLYGLVGHTRSTGRIEATIFDFPNPGSPSVTFPINIDLDGTTYGGGGTVAIGTKDYFATLDVNYTKTDFTSLDNKLFALVIAPRFGKVMKYPCFKGEVHIGAMYQDTAQKVELTLDAPLLGPIGVSLDQFEPKQWNFLVGTLWAIDERLHAIVELGTGGREYVISGLTARF